MFCASIHERNRVKHSNPALIYSFTCIFHLFMNLRHFRDYLRKIFFFPNIWDTDILIIVYRGSYMSAHFLLNLLNELEKRDKMRGLPSILPLFRNEFDKFNNTRARILDSIYHMIKSHFCRKNFIILSLCTQRCYGRHNGSRKSKNH